MSRIAQLKSYFNKERLIILGVVFVLYFNALKNGYSLDDSIVTQPENLTAQGLKAIPKILKSFYIGSSEDYQFDYRPLVKISFAIEHELFEVKPGTSHFFNLLFYVIGLFLFYGLLKLLFKEYNPHLPFYITLLFAAMPIHTEVVASLKNRDILLSFIFSMTGFRAYYYFYESGFKKWQYLIFSVIHFYLAFLSKFDALPFIAIIPAVFLVKDSGRLKWISLSIVAMIISLYLFKATKKGMIAIEETKRVLYYFENPMYFNKGMLHRFIAMFNSLGFYIVQCVYPIKQVCYYGYDTITILKIGSYGWLGIIAFPALAYGVIKSFLKKDLVLFTGLFMFCASSSMYLNFVKPAVGIVADRFAFFSSAGIAITAVGLLFNYFKSKDLPKNIKAVGIIVLILFSYSIITRVADWKDINTIIDADVAKYPNNAYLNYKKGMQIVKEVEKFGAQATPEQRNAALSMARQCLEKSIEVEPNYANSRNYLSYVLVYLINDFNAALPHINASLAYKENTELYYYKAIVMRETNHKDSAEYYLKKCIDMDIAFYNSYGLLMYDYNQNKQFDKSLNMFQKALDAGLETEAIYQGFAKTYEAMGDTAKAKENYREVVKLNPSNTEAAQKIK